MNPGTLALAALAAAAAGVAAVLYARLGEARSALAEALRRPAPAAAPPRAFESRRERFGLLWFPTLTVDDASRVVTAAAAGLPHCAKCVKPLALTKAAPEEWSCETCGEKRPGTVADIRVIDSVVSEALEEFFRRQPGYRPGPGVAAKGAAAG